ncbi:Subunit of the glycosylphosphatidylinositol transamidase complex-like protein [Marasmius sp. AFHP31]|nr:Subunit of the glycosylphosphatidylinositol transamidase complex-like protein [Marasmius sp. AFHP31]
MQLPFHLFFTFILLTCTSALGLNAATEEFNEDLSIRSLRDGKVASSFSFRTLLRHATPRDPRHLSSDDDNDISQHYTLFPLTLGQILRQYAITELHLTLNAGKWKYDSWGAPEELGVGTGAELWAWMADGGSMSVDDRWQGLRNALAGLFCASLGSLDTLRTTSPKLAFPPEGSLPDFGLPYQIRHASHASEHVCTENLTPFLKLLPCKSSSGLASLLNPHRLFDADWHGMGVHVTWKPEGIEVRLSFQLVSDPLRSTLVQRQNWSLESLFDRKIQKSCPAVHRSQISVRLPTNGMYRITPEPPQVDGNVALYELESALPEPLNVGMEWASDFEYSTSLRDSTLVPISIHRTLQGPSQDRGRLQIALKNNGPKDVKVLYLETMPWLLQFYLHTMSTEIDGIARGGLISNVSYIPPVPHSQPATFESVLLVPGNSTVTYSVDVTKAFLRYTEHPPDAQRGWDLPPAVFVPLSENDSRRIYTPALLVDLATPDFSMPYNVIIFTCSVVAFIFGSIFNLLTRKFVVVQLQGQN